MMQIVYFSQKEQFLTGMDSLKDEVLFISPSPAKADGLRESLSSVRILDVITMAKFTSNLVEHLWQEELRPQVKRKADLLLIFGVLKKKYLPQLGFEQFTQAYNLFSDLRSFTLDQDALSSVLEERPVEIKEAVRLFWKLLGLTGHLDEHAAYNKIAEALRCAEEIEELKKTYVFWGFQHLNGQQVDLLKALALRYKVIVPFPSALKGHLRNNDWVSWIKDPKTEEVELPVLPSVPKATWLPINSREIALHLREHLRPFDQVILGVSKLSSIHLDFVPSTAVSFKVPHQLVQLELQEIAWELKQEMSEDLALKEFQELLEKKKYASYKKLKARQLYQDAIRSIMDMTDEDIKVDLFFLKLLSEVTALNQPRTSYVTASPDELSIELKDMSSLEHVDRKRRSVLCIDDRFEEIQGLGQNYTEDIQRALAALGPLKRNELELLFKQWEFRDLFSQGEVLVLMSKETLKHSLVWKRMFSEIELIPMEVEGKGGERTPIDHFRSREKRAFEGSLSASKLQTFIDCPRKFYFSYVEKVFPRLVLEKDFDPMTSGTIIHEIIEKFFKRNLLDDQLRGLISEIMARYIKQHDLQLPRETYLQREMIFSHRSMNGIQFVRNLEKTLGEKIVWELEKEFELNDGLMMKGKIDCLGVGPKYLVLLDFKSTTGASGIEVERMDSVQLWSYAHAASLMVDDFESKTMIMGFVLLDDPKESRLFTDDKEFNKNFKGLCKAHAFKESFTDIFKENKDKILSLALNIHNEKSFNARPRKPDTCNFCELNKVCVKSETTNV